MSRRMVAMMVVLGVLLPAFASQAVAQGPQEGITVHGHWVIEVMEPDGTLASHTEFENALKGSGAGALAMLLGRGASIGSWMVSVMGSGLCDGGGILTTCYLAEPGGGASAFGVTFSHNLTVTPDSGQVILAGFGTAEAAGQIESVNTLLSVCAPIGQAACFSAPIGAKPFSGTNLPARVTVSRGQIIQVSVTLSFS